MTKLDEAIEMYTSNAEYERQHGNLQGCLEFRQLAEWLKDYKRLLEHEPTACDIEQIRAEIDGIEINGQIDVHTAFIRTGEQIKQMALDIIDKYRGDKNEADN